MGFVKSPEEIARIQQVLAEPHFFSSEAVTVEFRTRPEIVERLLPPGLVPADEPLASATIGRWGRSNCVHAFAGGSLNLRARHGDAVGSYCLSMPMSTDRAIIFGRELFGEPKKQADVSFERTGDRVAASCWRYGSPIIEIEAVLERELPAGESRSRAFHYKFLPRADGRGLESDPVLVMASFESKLNRISSGTGVLRLANTVHDPLGEVEIVEILAARYSEGDVYASARGVATVRAEDFLPYAYGKIDDWTALDNEKEAPWQSVRVPDGRA